MSTVGPLRREELVVEVDEAGLAERRALTSRIRQWTVVGYPVELVFQQALLTLAQILRELRAPSSKGNGRN